MNIHVTKTRSEQRIDQLVNAGRPLTDEESEELYRALHADYMHKWRAARARSDRRARDLTLSEPLLNQQRLLEKLREEARA